MPAQSSEVHEDNETVIAEGMVMFDIPDLDEEENLEPTPGEPAEEIVEETPPEAEE